MQRIRQLLKKTESARLRLRYKLGLAGAVAVSLMLFIGAIGVSSLWQIDAQISSNIYRRTVVANTANDLLHLTQEASALVFTMLAAVDSRETIRIADELRRNRQVAAKTLARLESFSADAHERELFAKVKTAQTRAERVINEILTRADQDLVNNSNAFTFNQQTLIQLVAIPLFRPSQRESLLATTEYLAYQRDAAEKSYIETSHEFARTLGSLIAVVLVSSLAGATTLFFIGKSVERPLTAATKAAKAIASGELAYEWASFPCSCDETGQLIDALKDMQSRLQIQMAMLEADILQKELTRNELQSQNAELQKLNAQLSATQAQLVQSEKLAALGALVAGVAHELNTPIGNGLTVASSIEESSTAFQRSMKEGLSRSQLEQYVQATIEGSKLVHRSLARAADLVQSFKQVAVDRTGEQRRQFELGDCLRGIQLTLLPQLKQTQHTFTIDIKEPIWMDSFPGPLGQVIDNLFNNSMNHGFEHQEAGEMILVVRKRDARVTLEFCDNGCGISQKNLPHIFEPFFTTRLGHGGSGLGLHLVHNIVTAVMGGEIHVSSTEGAGTRFTLDLPIEAPPGESGETSPSA